MSLSTQTPATGRFEGEPLLPNDNSVKQAARWGIDEKVQNLRQKIRDLQSRRNGLSPISSLPPQILTKIFIFVRDGCHHDTGYPYRYRLAWLRVIRVCRHWRGVAHACPELWSIISLNNPGLTREMLRHAKTIPLVIIHTVNREEALPQLEEIVNHLFHTQVFDLSWGEIAYSNVFHQALLRALTSPVPLLKTFHLKLGDSEETPGPEFHDTLATLSDDIFLDAPVLQEVELSKIDLQWGPTLFRNVRLSSLKLEHIRPPSFTHLIEVLKKTPELRALALVDALPRTGASLNVKDELLGPGVCLNRLEDLVVHDSVVSAAAFLPCLLHPPHCHLDFRVVSRSDQGSLCTRTLEIISQHLRRLHVDSTSSIPQIKSAFLAGGLNRPFEFKLFDKSLEICAEAHWKWKAPDLRKAQPLVKMTFSGSGSTGLHNRVFQDLFSVFDLSHVTDLEFSPNFDFPRSHILHASCGSLPKLETIRVSKCIPWQLQESLENTRSPPSETFATLKTIVIEDGDFGYTRYPHHIKDLIVLLKHRQSSRFPIKRLILNGPRHLKNKRLLSLHELVDRIDVNGEPVDMSTLEPGAEHYRTKYWGEDDENLDDY